MDGGFMCGDLIVRFRLVESAAEISLASAYS